MKKIKNENFSASKKAIENISGDVNAQISEKQTDQTKVVCRDPSKYQKKIGNLFLLRIYMCVINLWLYCFLRMCNSLFLSIFHHSYTIAVIAVVVLSHGIESIIGKIQRCSRKLVNRRYRPIVSANIYISRTGN